MVRDFTKWDDLPVAALRGIRGARPDCDDAADDAGAARPRRRPAGRSDLAEVKERLRIQKTAASPPRGDAGAVAKRRACSSTRNRDHRRPPGAHAGGMAHLVELAELLQAPVIDQGGRMNFPTAPAEHVERRSRCSPTRTSSSASS
jgi:hypothetical protein